MTAFMQSAKCPVSKWSGAITLLVYGQSMQGTTGSFVDVLGTCFKFRENRFCHGVVQSDKRMARPLSLAFGEGE